MGMALRFSQSFVLGHVGAVRKAMWHKEAHPSGDCGGAPRSPGAKSRMVGTISGLRVQAPAADTAA